MKKCSYCGTEYPDEEKICPIDHAQMNEDLIVLAEAPRKWKLKFLLITLIIALLPAAIWMGLITAAIYSTVSHSFTVYDGSVNRKFYASTRLKLEVKAKDQIAQFKWNSYRDQFKVIKSLLTSPETHRILANRNGTDEKAFSFEGVGPVRGTQLIYIEYSSVDSYKVEAVSSNAANLVVSFYATNDLAIEVTRVDSFTTEMPSFWQQVHTYLNGSGWWPFP